MAATAGSFRPMPSPGPGATGMPWRLRARAIDRPWRRALLTSTAMFDQSTPSDRATSSSPAMASGSAEGWRHTTSTGGAGWRKSSVSATSIRRPGERLVAPPRPRRHRRGRRRRAARRTLDRGRRPGRGRTGRRGRAAAASSNRAQSTSPRSAQDRLVPVGEPVELVAGASPTLGQGVGHLVGEGVTAQEMAVLRPVLRRLGGQQPADEGPLLRCRQQPDRATRPGHEIERHAEPRGDGKGVEPAREVGQDACCGSGRPRPGSRQTTRTDDGR